MPQRSEQGNLQRQGCGDSARRHVWLSSLERTLEVGGVRRRRDVCAQRYFEAGTLTERHGRSMAQQTISRGSSLSSSCCRRFAGKQRRRAELFELPCDARSDRSQDAANNLRQVSQRAARCPSWSPGDCVRQTELHFFLSRATLAGQAALES